MMRLRTSMPKTLVVVMTALALLSGAVTAGESQAPSARGSGPRTAWGEPDLAGVWMGSKLGASGGKDTFNLAPLERLYKPEARAKMKGMSAKDDPILQCFPPPFPYALRLGWPIQIVQRPGMLFVLSEAFHTYRVVPTDGRNHQEDYLVPSFLGDSVGRWDAETLVVDVISFNGRSWLASSQDRPTAASLGVWPTSDGMHIVERWRRVDANTLEYQARVEDDTLLTGTWDTPRITLRRQPVARIEEAKCLTNDPAVPPASYLGQFGR